MEGLEPASWKPLKAAELRLAGRSAACPPASPKTLLAQFWGPLRRNLPAEHICELVKTQVQAPPSSRGTQEPAFNQLQGGVENSQLGLPS